MNNEVFTISDGVLTDIKEKPFKAWEERVKLDYMVPDEVTEIRGVDVVPFAMNIFQITNHVSKIDLKAFSMTATIRKFIVVDYDTREVLMKERFEVNQGSCEHPSITQLPEFKKFLAKCRRKAKR